MADLMRIGPIVGDFESAESRDLVLILHGLGGHRDYCYQKRLGKALPALGLNSFRFDFRSCGDSDDLPDPARGRSVAGTDCEDLDLVYRHFAALGYRLHCLVAHSRGVACAFTWLLRYQVFVPFVVNCSGRFIPATIKERYDLSFPNFRKEGGYFHAAKRHGKTMKLWVPMAEIEEYAEGRPEEYAQLHPASQVLTVFGLKDHIVSPEESGYWLNLFGERGTAFFIPDADHNFYAKIENKHQNLNPLVVERICAWLQAPAQLERWHRATAQVPHPRWALVEGVPNFRDFGGYGPVVHGCLYRSAAPARITFRGIEQLRELKVTDIFDLRGSAERARAPTPEVPGVCTHSGFELVHAHASSPAPAHAHARPRTAAYMEILDTLQTSGALESITARLCAGARVLIHCTAGKDRTGVVCAVLLRALGVDSYTVAQEYELTTVGYRAQREKVAEALPPGLDPGLREEMLGSEAATILEMLERLDARYGSIQGYFGAAGLAAQLPRLQGALTRRMQGTSFPA